MNDYYVYAYLDPDRKGNYVYGEYIFDFEPFYIGKGKKMRMKIHIKKADDPSHLKKNPEFYKKIKDLVEKGTEPLVIKLNQNLNENEAFDLEKIYIKEIGRRTEFSGPLLNKTKGGNGFRGCNSYRGGFRKEHSKETKNKLSEYHKGKSFIEKVGEEKAKKWKENISKSNKGKKRLFSDASIENIRNIWLGKKMPSDVREKMSEKRKGISPWNKGKKIYQYTTDNQFISEILLHEIPKEFNIPASNVIKCCKGERKSAGGYVWKYTKN